MVEAVLLIRGPKPLPHGLLIAMVIAFQQQIMILNKTLEVHLVGVGQEVEMGMPIHNLARMDKMELINT